MTLKQTKTYRIRSFFLLLFIIIFTAIPVSASDLKVVRVGFFRMDGYHMVDEYGERSGYGYEYLQNLAKYTDFSYEYVGYNKSWSEMQDMLERGEIDLLTCAKKTDERKRRFDFTEHTIGTNVGILTVEAGDTRYMTEDYSQYNRIVVGMQEKNIRNQDFADFAREKGFSYVPVYFRTDEELLDALHNDGMIDAIVTSNLRKTNNEWIAATFAPSPFYAMVRKGNTELLKEVDRAIEQVDEYTPNLQTSLHSKYYSVNSGDEIAYSADERNYIRSIQEAGTPIEILIAPDSAPLSYLEDNKALGIIPDIAEIILGRAGIPYKIVMPGTRSEYRSMMAGGEVDICFDSRYDFNEAERYGYKLTDPYIELALSCVTLKNFNGAPRTIAALKSSNITSDYIDKVFDGTDVVFYDTMEECVDAILSGRQDAAYFHTYAAQELVYKDIRNQLKSVLIPEYTTKLSVSVRHSDFPLLFPILNKAVLNLNPDELNRIILKQTTYPLSKFSLTGYLYENPMAIAALMGAAGLGMLAVLLQFFKRKNTKLERERIREFERFITYVCRVNDEVIEMDMNKKRCFSYRVEEGNVFRMEHPAMNAEDFRKQICPEDFSLVTSIIEEGFIDDLIDNGKEICMECRSKRKGLDYQWHSYTLQGLPGDEEYPRSLMVFIKNIDRVKKDEMDKRQVMKDALSAAMRASESKGAFMSRMSHEIRTPLNAIIGYITLACASIDHTEKVRDCLKKSEFAARHLLNVINDVLDISAIESGRMKIASEPFDITETISGLTSIFFAQAREKGVRFEVYTSGLTVKRMIGDSLRVNQILINLLSNALKFTSRGNEVTLSVAQKIIIDNKVHLQIKVEDTGIGISESYMERLFTPFEQQDASTARKYGGTGLGLSITKNLIDMMNGTIDVISREGDGTSFTVGLAFEMVHLEEDVSAEAVTMTGGAVEELSADQDGLEAMEAFKAQLRNVCILLVEDNELNMEISLEMLENAGLIVEGAADGQIAVSLFKAAAPGTYAAILMDIQMPVMDGYEAARRIRSSGHPQAADIPIIALTADVFAEDINRALAAGMNDHVSKPIDFTQLLAVLCKYIVAEL